MMTIKELKREITKLNNNSYNHNNPKWEQEFFEIVNGIYVCKTKEKDVFYLHTNDGHFDYYTKDGLINFAREMGYIK